MPENQHLNCTQKFHFKSYSTWHFSMWMQSIYSKIGTIPNCWLETFQAFWWHTICWNCQSISFYYWIWSRSSKLIVYIPITMKPVFYDHFIVLDKHHKFCNNANGVSKNQSYKFYWFSYMNNRKMYYATLQRYCSVFHLL